MKILTNNDDPYGQKSSKCADLCKDSKNCIAFSYKDKLNDQVCRLSSVCTDKNANKNEDYTLYVEENIDYSNFPLSNYKIIIIKNVNKMFMQINKLMMKNKWIKAVVH